MNKKIKPEKAVSITIRGDVSGQIAIGKNNRQTQTEIQYSVSDRDLKKLHLLFRELHSKVEATVESKNRDAALKQVQELEEAVTAKKPNISKMEKVKKWFGKNVPALAGAVTSVVVHPIVGKLVEAGGDLLVKDFQRRFGEDS